MRALRAFVLGLGLALTLALAGGAQAEPWLERAPDAIRVATLNAGLVRKGAGMLVHEMVKGSAQIDAVAEIILRVRPDILLLTKFDRDPAHRALTGFAERLRAGVAGLEGLDYPFLYQGPVNTGLPSGHDLDGDGYRRGPRDAFGYGRFPGQYAMALMSRYPIDYDRLRGFRRFRWADLPGADRPVNADGTPYHPDPVWGDLRLSSVSQWDVPVTLPGDVVLHVLASHPTPPVFDGPEDFNGRRNADEIRLLLGLIDGADWLVDDRGQGGGLGPGDLFVVAGDLNADPYDGEARRAAIGALLAHPRVQDPMPESAGGAQAARSGGANATHRGPPAQDTADWRDEPGPGNMRVDYVLPSTGLEVTGSGIFWPLADDPLARLIAGGRRPASSDHRLVWVDIAVEQE
ncbi:MAG: endonuclease/exonuclease/phosphatase family protein [Thermohalobaculum sp.]